MPLYAYNYKAQLNSIKVTPNYINKKHVKEGVKLKLKF
jgi:hypothetical protein